LLYFILLNSCSLIHKKKENLKRETHDDK